VLLTLFQHYICISYSLTFSYIANFPSAIPLGTSLKICVYLFKALISGPLSAAVYRYSCLLHEQRRALLSQSNEVTPAQLRVVDVNKIQASKLLILLQLEERRVRRGSNG